MRIPLFLSLALAFISGGILFRVKHEVLSLEKTIKDFSCAIATNKEEITLLSSEWSYLTNPERVSKLIGCYYPHARPLSSNQVVPSLRILK